jgi:hypothetical protein
VSGHSSKTLREKLGLKGEVKVFLHNAPVHFEKLLGEGLLLRKRLSSRTDHIHGFFKERNDYFKNFGKLKKSLSKTGSLWISWPKKTSRFHLDLDENMVREFALTQGLVDTKVVAVDENWSALRLVYRLRDR